MDELRALAYLDLLLNRDSRPSPGSPPGSSGHQDGDGTASPAARAARRSGRAAAARRRASRRRSGSARVRAGRVAA